MTSPSTRLAALLAASLAAACSSFVGYTPRAPADVAPADDGAAALDATPPPDVAPFRCGAGRGPCDPVANTGCPAGQDCRVADAVTLQTACGAAGEGIAGSECDAESDCGPGLHCLTPPSGVCVRLCCPDGAAGACASEFGPYSRCSVPTNNVLVYGCTVNNACDYVDQRGCTPGFQCMPGNVGGAARCVPPGEAPLGGSCMTGIGCVRGATCVFPGPAPLGTCRAVCNPIATNRCPTGVCSPLYARPADWGACGVT